MAIFSAAFAWPLARRQIILSDEGYLLAQVMAILDGQVLYRDLDSFVSPAIWYVLAGWFRLVGASVIHERVVAVVCFALLCTVAYRIVSRLAPAVYAWVAVAALWVLCVWAFPLWTFAFYSPFAVLAALAALDRVLAWRERDRTRDLLLAGVLLGLAAAFKQNYGAFAVLGISGGVLACCVESRGLPAGVRSALLAAPRLFAGFAAVAIPVVGYFALHGALQPFWDSLALRPITFSALQGIPYLSPLSIWTGSLGEPSVSYTYGAPALPTLGVPAFYDSIPGFTERLHGLLFWLPALLLVGGAVASLKPLRSGRRLDGGVAAVTILAGTLFLGVFPRADYAHLVYVYPPLPVVGAIVWARFACSRAPPRVRRVAGVAGLLVLAPFVLAAGSWYLRALEEYGSRLELDRGGVLLRELDKISLESVVEFLRSSTSQDEAVFTVPDLAMLNFLAGRPQAGRYFNLYEHHVGHDDGREVVDEVEARRVRWVVARYDNFFSNPVPLREYAPVLWNHLRRNFEVLFVHFEQQFVLLRRRPQPRRDLPFVPVIPTCDTDGEQPGTQTGEHLLFSSLRLYPDHRAGAVEVRCRLVVPEGDVDLVADAGPRRPAYGASNARMMAEVFVESEAGRDRLWSERARLPLRDSWRETRWGPRRIDLGRYAGHEITLVFRAQLQSAAWINEAGDLPFEWIDPRIETRSAAGEDGAGKALP